MNEARIRQSDLFNQLPPEWSDDLLPVIQQRIRESGRKVVVLDDDPTGTQTVHDVPVLTHWALDPLVEELNGSAAAIYLLTNSRSLPLAEAQALNTEVGARLKEAQRRSGQRFSVISRSDSTLRGHFPGEMEALAEALAKPVAGAQGQLFDAWVLAPFFAEGGRYTIDDVHYVAEGEWLTPAGQTEFARDAAFGYRASNLREWVVEKTAGAVPLERVAAISIEDLRKGGPEVVAQRLLALPRGAVCLTNAASNRDLEVLVTGLLLAEVQGKRYLYRTAASFVRVYAGIAPQPLLTRTDLHLPSEGAGLVIAGSYVPRTSSQLELLFNQTKIQPVEIQVPRLLDEAARSGEIERVTQEVNRLLAHGHDTAVYTSRALVSAANAADPARANLAIGRTVSDSLIAIVHGLSARPRYLLAKGGITSSDTATRGLGIKRAWVLGQVYPGVPVWQSGPESRFPGLPYIVFPGNVGAPDALVKIVNELLNG